MRYLKMLLAGFIVLAIVFILFSFLIPSSVKISRVAEVYAPKAKIQAALSDMNQWPHWVPWSAADSLYTVAIKTQPGGVESSYEWVYKKDVQQKGKITITAITPDEIKTITNLTGYKESPGSLKLYTNPKLNYVLVEWKINVQLPWYPWTKLKGILMDKILGPVLEDGLERLKTYTENG